MSNETVCLVETLMNVYSVILSSTHLSIAGNAVHERIAIYCITWSIAGRLIDHDRQAFDIFLRSQTNEIPEKVHLFAFKKLLILEKLLNDWSCSPKCSSQS